MKAVLYEICILAGGLSRRMGQDKARLRLGSRSMLSQIRSEARATGLPVRIIRRDAVPRCGPLGGIYTALKTTSARAVLFLACDMPFVSADMLQSILERGKNRSINALFVSRDRTAGFPFLLPKAALPVVGSQIETGQFSLQGLARTLGAKRFRLPRGLAPQLRNINTRAEFERACRMWAKRLKHAHSL